MACSSTIQALLASPAFLYRTEFGSAAASPESSVLTGYETASRLSYFLWSTMPDEALFAAAEQGKLADPADIEAEVRRMLAHEKARAGMLNFHREWLKLEAVDKVLKKPEDAYDQALAAELKESVDRFVWETLFVRPGSARELMTAASFPATPRIAQLLGAAPGAPGSWTWTPANATQRAGILTHPAFLSSHGYAKYPSPVLRGVYVLDRILCCPPRPPPPGVNATDSGRREQPHAAHQPRGLRRCDQRRALHDVPHQDQRLRLRVRELRHDGSLPQHRQRISRGHVGRGAGLEFDDAVELAASIGDSAQYRQCLVQKWTAYAAGGGPLAGDQCCRPSCSTLSPRAVSA